MALSDVVKGLFLKNYFTFTFPSLTDQGDGTIASFVVPENCVLVSLDCVYTAEAGGGTTPAIGIAVKRSSTTLVSVAQADMGTAGTGASSTAAAALSKGEVLTIVADTANADNDFQGLTVIVGVRPVFDEE